MNLRMDGVYEWAMTKYTTADDQLDETNEASGGKCKAQGATIVATTVKYRVLAKV